MTKSSALRCAIVGETTLPEQCIEMLIERGHIVTCVATEDADVTRAALAAGVAAVVAPVELADALRESPVDYLFSVNHVSVIAEEVLALPQRGAINFHDGPLPGYAGLNTPSWAILNGETSWAITWHAMTSGVDEGAILVEEPVEIDAEDTSGSLNFKCYEAAIRSFGRLVEGLATAALAPREQELSKRVYYSRGKRPPAAGVLLWSRSASELSAEVRALDFGRYPNPLCLPKLLLDDDAVVVAALEVLDSRGGAPPGTVVAIAPESITVATATADVALTRLRTQENHALTVADLVRRYGLHEGRRMPEPSADEIAMLTALHESLAQHETVWTARLASLLPLQVPGIDAGVGPGTDAGVGATSSRRERHDIPEAARSVLERLDGGGPGGDALVIALGLFLGRLAGQSAYDVAYAEPAPSSQPRYAPALLADAVPLRFEPDPGQSFAAALSAALDQLRELRARAPYLRDLIPRSPQLKGAVLSLPVAISQRGAVAQASLTLVVGDGGSSIEWLYEDEALDDVVATMRRELDAFLHALADDAERPLSELRLLTREDLRQIIVDWNDTAVEYPRELCVHQLIEQQAARTPNQVAIVCDGQETSYAELCRQARSLAGHLRALGVEPGRRVGVCLERSTDLVIGLLAILEAGGAYVPLDPSYPAERIRFMIEDSNPVAVLCQSAHATELLEGVEHLVVLDAEPRPTTAEPTQGPTPGPCPDDPAYVIYTSGSTGRPKGVIVSHRNVVNFIHGMDPVIDHDPAGTFLAVTSVSFDISVLELFWTLARGFEVVMYTGSDRQPAQGAGTSSRPLDFSLFFFASEERDAARERYRMLTEAVKFADTHGFSAVWTPERHFHAFGGLFPNPSLTSAVIAALTEHVEIRAGSVVSPLHSPIRIAEEWSFVDNISAGRVGISFASGWQPDDFVLAPQNFADRKELMFRQIEVIQRLWRGDAVALPGPLGKDVETRILPRPIQAELPVWITAAGSPDTFRMAGERGFGVLTHLLGQSVTELGQKIEIYREARAAASHDPSQGHIALMLHTFVGPDEDLVRELVRAPMKAYLRSSVGLIQRAAWTFPTFKQATTGDDGSFSLDNLSEEELDAVLDFSFERYFETSGLLGTPQKCVELVEQLRAIGVDEIACLIDFHDDAEAVLRHLPHIDTVRAQATAASQGAEDRSIPALIARHRVSHMQCTPSLASMLVQTDDGRRALGSLRQLLVGGEAFPPALAATLHELVEGDVTNMYGPTETTIWSSSFHVDGAHGAVPIGRPIANTQLYILDDSRQPVAVGSAGELYIGGDGVTLGYLERPELTGERFVTDPFRGQPGARMYRTGDLARYRQDGNVEFLGRVDHQVKIRGYRIELGEIEAALGRHPDVNESVVVAVDSGNDGEHRLIAYVVARNAAGPSAESLRAHLSQRLPDFMIPSGFEVLSAMPRTPNGKVDRASLPAVGSSQAARETEHVSPRDEVERALVDIWERELGVKPIGVEENFFELGGHSLLAVRVFAQLKRTLGVELPLAAFLRAPTITQLAELIRDDAPQTASSWRSLVEIEAGGAKPPLFCVHAHGGHVLFYKDLARHLGSERPFYALQAQGVDGTLAPLTRFEEMAANYVREIRSVQPRGPYHLGGDCLGGVVAYEMAQQLVAGGDEVAIVAMFDSFHPRYRPYLPQPLYELIHQVRLLFGFNLVNLVRLPWPEKLVYVRAKVQHAAYRARYLGWAVQRDLARREEPADDPLIRTQTALDEAFDAYEPKRYEGRTALFRATRQPTGIRKDPALGWGGLIPQLDVYEIPAYFTTGVYEPAVAQLAAQLRRCLDGVDRDDDSDGRQLVHATQDDRRRRLRRFRRREMTRT